MRVAAWGPGAAWAVDRAGDLLGLHDGDGDLPAGVHPAVDGLHRRFPGVRASRSGAVVEALVPTVIGQLVVTAEARRSYRRLVLALGEPAPGPVPLRLPPAPERLATLPYHGCHRFGLERRRAEILRLVGRHARELERLAAPELADAAVDAGLRRLRGIGPWTAALVRQAARGDPDAVPVGDYNLPSLVGWVLAGEPGADDERMLELLEPFAGHRARVLRLVKLGGGRPPRHAPRARLRDIVDR